MKIGILTHHYVKNFGALAGNKKVQLDWDYMDATGYDISRDNTLFWI